MSRFVPQVYDRKFEVVKKLWLKDFCVRFNGLMIAAELEKASNMQFTMEDVLSVKKVGDIKKILDKYQVEYEC